MPKPQNVKSQTSKKSLRHKKLYITLALVLGIPLLLLGILDIPYQLRVHKLQTANQQVWDEIVKPMGATQEFSNVSGPHVWNICVDNGPCPSANEGWFVLIESGNQKAIKQEVINLLKKNNYSVISTDTDDRDLTANKDRLRTDFEFSSVGSIQPPHPAPNGKSWMQLGVSTFEEE